MFWCVQSNDLFSLTGRLDNQIVIRWRAYFVESNMGSIGHDVRYDDIAWLPLVDGFVAVFSDVFAVFLGSSLQGNKRLYIAFITRVEFPRCHYILFL